MHRSHAGSPYRPRLEVLEDRTTPAPLGLSHLPSAAQAGLAIAASHHGSSQAGNHSPVFQTSATATKAATVPTLPAAAGKGIANAAVHNASSQASNHSPVFKS